MRAWRVEREGGPDAIRLSDVEDPQGGLVIEVSAAGVGFPDLLMSRGAFQIRQPPPFTLGWEAAGTVVDAPPGAAFTSGDRVVTLSFGAFAERLVAEEATTFRLPDGLSFLEGAALPLNYLTALAALDRRGRLRPGEQVLVHGAGGGVGSAVVQVGKALGATVIAVVSDDAKAEVARAAGADEVVLLAPGWGDGVVALSAGGVDLAVDAVGGERFDETVRCLRSEGRVVVVGFAGGHIPALSLNRLVFRNAEVGGVTWSALASAPGGLTGSMDRLGQMIGKGHVRPIVRSVAPFEDAPSALRSLDRREAFGKVVLEVGTSIGTGRGGGDHSCS